MVGITEVQDSQASHCIRPEQQVKTLQSSGLGLSRETGSLEVFSNILPLRVTAAAMGLPFRKKGARARGAAEAPPELLPRLLPPTAGPADLQGSATARCLPSAHFVNGEFSDDG